MTKYKIWIDDENFPVVSPNTLTYSEAAMESECVKLNKLGVSYSVEPIVVGVDSAA